MNHTVERKGWRRKPWCAAVGIGLSTSYALPAHLQPQTVRIGKSVVIVESPEEYLKRVAEQQKQAA